MKILVLSDRLEFGPGISRLVSEGHEVCVWFRDLLNRDFMSGIVKRASTVEDGVAWGPDLVVVDGCRVSHLIKKGVPVVAGGRIQENLETDSWFTNRAMESFGVDVPPCFAFDSVLDAARFALAHPNNLVFRSRFSTWRDFNFYPRSRDELVSYLSQLKNERNIDGPCILQEKVRGNAVWVESWVSHGKIVGRPVSYIGSDNNHTLAWAYPVREPRIFQKTVKKIKILLEKRNYTGPLAIRGMMDGEEFKVTEVQTGFNGARLAAFLTLLREDFGHFLRRVAGPADILESSLDKGVSFQVRVSLQPYPFRADTRADQAVLFRSTKGVHVEGVEADAWGKTIFPIDIKSVSKNVYRTAGISGAVFDATSCDEKVDIAVFNALSLARSVQIPGKEIRFLGNSRMLESILSVMRASKYETPLDLLSTNKAVSEELGSENVRGVANASL